eukprot:200858_1
MSTGAESKKRKMEPEGFSETTESIETEGPTLETVRSWLAGFSREAALDFIAKMAATYPDVLEKVQSRLHDDPSFTKLFVRSLDWETTDEALNAFFIQYGEIKESVVLRDAQTGRSKGFGFVTFASKEGAQLALREPTKQLDGRTIFVHLASEKNSRPTKNFGSSAPVFSQWNSSPASNVATRDTKVFIHGLAYSTTTEQLQDAYQSFGPILEAAVIYDRKSGKSKGFGFVTFHSPMSAQLACKEGKKHMGGRWVQCNMASERRKSQSDSNVQQTAPASLVLTGSLGSGLMVDPMQLQIQQLQQQQAELQQRLGQQTPQQTPQQPPQQDYSQRYSQQQDYSQRSQQQQPYSQRSQQQYSQQQYQQQQQYRF